MGHDPREGSAEISGGPSCEFPPGATGGAPYGGAIRVMGVHSEQGYDHLFKSNELDALTVATTMRLTPKTQLRLHLEGVNATNRFPNRAMRDKTEIDDDNDIAVDEDDDVEMRLLEDREMVKSEKSDEESEDTPRSIKCQLIIAFLGILALIPMVGIVVYLVGMFYDVPDTTKS